MGDLGMRYQPGKSTFKGRSPDYKGSGYAAWLTTLKDGSQGLSLKADGWARSVMLWPTKKQEKLTVSS